MVSWRRLVEGFKEWESKPLGPGWHAPSREEEVIKHEIHRIREVGRVRAAAAALELRQERQLAEEEARDRMRQSYAPTYASSVPGRGASAATPSRQSAAGRDTPVASPSRPAASVMQDVEPMTDDERLTLLKYVLQGGSGEVSNEQYDSLLERYVKEGGTHASLEEEAADYQRRLEAYQRDQQSQQIAASVSPRSPEIR